MNAWEKTFGAIRRAKDRALLAALEAQEIANEEKLRAAEAKKNPAPCVSDEERLRIARAFGRQA